MNTIVNMKPF